MKYVKIMSFLLHPSIYSLALQSIYQLQESQWVLKRQLLKHANFASLLQPIAHYLVLTTHKFALSFSSGCCELIWLCRCKLRQGIIDI